MLPTRVRQVQSIAMQEEVTDHRVAHVGDTRPVTDVGPPPELPESCTGSGQFTDHPLEIGIVGVITRHLAQTAYRDLRRLVPVDEEILGRGFRSRQARMFCPGRKPGASAQARWLAASTTW